MRFGLRARVATAVVLVTTTATVVMAFAAYQLQAGDAKQRYIVVANSQVKDAWSRATALMDDKPRDPIATLTKAIGPLEGPWVMVARKPGGPPSVAGGSGLPTEIEVPDLPAVLDRVSEVVLIPPKGLLDSTTAATLTDPATGRTLYVVGAHFTGTDYYLVEFFDFSALDPDLTKLRWNLAWLALGVSVLGVGAALVIARRVRRPILRVSSAARELGGGAFDVRVPVSGRDELSDLAKSFNAMATRLGESVEELREKDRQQRQFVADVAHDLRTPLASMVALAGNLDSPDPATRARAAELVSGQTRRLARLVEDLLEIARFDAGKADFRAEPVDLPALVEDACRTCDLTAVDIVTSGDLTLIADPRRVHTIVCNLLTNAAGHGAPPITVTLSGLSGPSDSDSDEVVVRVADSGPGVPEELLPTMFDRFVRGDRARQATSGSGLGLAIARENAAVHRGSLTVHNGELGAVFTLTLPRAGDPGDAVDE